MDNYQAFALRQLEGELRRSGISVNNRALDHEQNGCDLIILPAEYCMDGEGEIRLGFGLVVSPNLTESRIKEIHIKLRQLADAIDSGFGAPLIDVGCFREGTGECEAFATLPFIDQQALGKYYESICEFSMKIWYDALEEPGGNAPYRGGMDLP